ncbi:MAG: hypothetical protein K9L22_07610 [Methylococcaceae bacterium]|nr:hypothetical protein [Methylococcaceae bacterium]
MSILKQKLQALLQIVHELKDEHLNWRQSRQGKLGLLKKQEQLDKHDLQSILKKRSVQIEHEIAAMQTKNSAELVMLKIKYKQDIQDYKQYLNALDQLKGLIQKSYPHLPESIAFTIHHHAKHLLNSMWEENNINNKRVLELELIQLMNSIHEDAQTYPANNAEDSLPANTLKLISRHSLNIPSST